jgi:hypothetical protein
MVKSNRDILGLVDFTAIWIRIDQGSISSTADRHRRRVTAACRRIRAGSGGIRRHPEQDRVAPYDLKEVGAGFTLL